MGQLSKHILKKLNCLIILGHGKKLIFWEFSLPFVLHRAPPSQWYVYFCKTVCKQIITFLKISFFFILFRNIFSTVFYLTFSLMRMATHVKKRRFSKTGFIFLIWIWNFSLKSIYIYVCIKNKEYFSHFYAFKVAQNYITHL